MGFFGTYLYDSSGWTAWQAGKVPATAERWLYVDIHDSDIATVMYRPAGPGSGTAYLGYTPRTYFENEDASAATDVPREASGLAAWWESDLAEGVSDEDRTAKEAELASYLAGDQSEGDALDATDDIDDASDDDVFVEVKAARFLTALGLSLPEDLNRPPS